MLDLAELYLPSIKPLPPLQSGNLQIFGMQAWIFLFLALTQLHIACYLSIKSAMIGKKSRFATLKADAQLAAHFLPQLVGFVLTAYVGAGDWLYDMPSHTGLSIASYVPQGERVSCVIIGFQLYEIVALLLSPVRARLLHILSHSLLTRLSFSHFSRSGCAVRTMSSFCTTRSRCCSLGCATISKRTNTTRRALWASPSSPPCRSPLSTSSNIFQRCACAIAAHRQHAFLFTFDPLTPLSLALLLVKHTKQVKAHFPITNEAVRNVFAVSFLWVRGFYWPYCSIAFWRTQLAIFAAQAAAAASATARKPAPPPLLQTPTIYTFLACNVLMTGLQWYWASIILTAIWRLVTGDPRHKDA